MTIILYVDNEGLWRWHVRAGNGEIIASGESHKRRWNAKRSARRAFPGCPIQVEN